MKEIVFNDFPDVTFGKNVIIKGNDIQIRDGAYIGDDVIIESNIIDIGYDSKIEHGNIIKGLGKPMESFHLGDNCFLGFKNQILVPEFSMNDYSQLHNSGLHSGYKPLNIGYNCWIGQNTILNSTENLTIHNNVRIGTQSQLWTHVASGELLEGCTLYGTKPLELKDNVWIVGGAVISPGLLLEEFSIIMTGSVLTKSTIAKHTYAGVPAKDVTDKLSFWNDVTVEIKYEMIEKFVSEFCTEYPIYSNRIKLIDDMSKVDLSILDADIIICKNAIDFDKYVDNSYSLFDLSAKVYSKKRSKIEIDWIRFNNGYRARFIPFKK